MNYSVIIPCAGKGTRMGLGYNKLFAYIGKQTVIEKTIDIFLKDERCSQIIIPYNRDDEVQIKKLLNNNKVYFVEGADERYKSVYQGLQIVSENKVLIHDGARPFLTQECLNRLLEEVSKCDACLLGVKMVDTIKYVENGIVKNTLDRNLLYKAQTPQAFTTSLLMKAYDKAIKSNRNFTDDVSVIEAYFDIDIRMVEGDYSNIKITNKDDLNMYK